MGQGQGAMVVVIADDASMAGCMNMAFHSHLSSIPRWLGYASGQFEDG